MSLSDVQRAEEIRVWAVKFWARMVRQPPEDAVAFKTDLLTFGSLMMEVYGRDVLIELGVQLKTTAPPGGILRLPRPGEPERS